MLTVHSRAGCGSELARIGPIASSAQGVRLKLDTGDSTHIASREGGTRTYMDVVRVDGQHGDSVPVYVRGSDVAHEAVANVGRNRWASTSRHQPLSSGNRMAVAMWTDTVSKRLEQVDPWKAFAFL